MPEALVELVPLALLLFCLAFVWSARKLLAAMFGALINAVNSVHIPYLGEAIAGVLHSMEQAIDNALGSVESGVDSLLGASWHRFSQLNSWLWREFTANTLIGYLTAQLVGELVHGYQWIRGQIHDLHGLHAWVNARVKSLEKQWSGIEGRVKALENDWKKGIGHDLRVGLKAAQADLAAIEHTALPAIRSAEAEAQSAIDNLYEWAKGKAALLGVGTFAAAVTAVIGVDALRAIKCPSFLSSFKRRGCGLFNGIEDMLGLFVDLFLVADFCEVIPLLEEAYSEVAAPAIGLLTAAIDSTPCVQGNQAPALTVPALHLPSNPGIALSLP